MSQTIKLAIAAIRQKLASEYSYSSTQMNFPEEIAAEFRNLQAQIAPEDLADGGAEAMPHVTVKYGLHDSEPEPIKTALADSSPVTVEFDSVTLFENDDADVLKFDIISEGLHQLNAKVSKLPNTDKHPNYLPHATIAYVKPGRGKYYQKLFKGNKLTGKALALDTVYFSPKEGNPVDIKLDTPIKVASKLLNTYLRELGKIR